MGRVFLYESIFKNEHTFNEQWCRLEKWKKQYFIKNERKKNKIERFIIVQVIFLAQQTNFPKEFEKTVVVLFNERFLKQTFKKYSFFLLDEWKEKSQTRPSLVFYT